MKEKRHLVMWVEVIALAVLLARLETVRIRENAKEVQEYTCAGREQEGAQMGNGKREEKTVSDKVIGARNRRSEKKLEDTLEKNVTEKKKAALTFDDGPNSKYTPLLLKGLKERGVHATFFLMGKNIEGKEAWVKQIQEEGHLIGNHTYHHVNLSKMSAEQAQAELDATDELVRKITGKYPIYARAPYGEVPENGDVDRQRFYIGWTVDPLDWMTEDVSRITQSVLEKVEPGDIILLHDSYLSSVQAALRIVDALQGKGYEFITVDQMISD